MKKTVAAILATALMGVSAQAALAADMPAKQPGKMDPASHAGQGMQGEQKTMKGKSMSHTGHESKKSGMSDMKHGASAKPIMHHDKTKPLNEGKAPMKDGKMQKSAM